MGREGQGEGKGKPFAERDESRKARGAGTDTAKGDKEWWCVMNGSSGPSGEKRNRFGAGGFNNQSRVGGRIRDISTALAPLTSTSSAP